MYNPKESGFSQDIKKRNTWDITSDLIEPRESAIKATRRELFEEAGLKSKKLIQRLYYCATDEFPIPPKEFEMAETRLFSNTLLKFNT